MKLSVIVPVYNAEKYLYKCVDNLLSQTLKDIEIILVNDGSSDKSGEICDDYQKHHENIIVIHKENGGSSSARNVGLDVARGEYVGFVDCDDFVHKDYYKILIEECEKNNCDVAQMSFKKIYDHNLDINFEVENYETKVYDVKDLIVSDYSSMKNVFHTSVTVKVLKREIFNDLRFNEDISNLEDVYLKPDIMLRSNKIVVIDLALYYYFINKNSKTINRKNKKHTNITVDIHINKVLWKNNIENINKITQNRFFSVLYTFSKMVSYYDKKQLEYSKIEIFNFYNDKLICFDLYFKILFLLFIKEKYTLLKSLCVLTFDIYKKMQK